MPAISSPVERLIAVRRPARDPAWHSAAVAACREALGAGRFADVLALAEVIGPAAQRERDLARFGTGLPLAKDAHPDAVRAARALAGRDPALVAGMKASDPRRRALELTWELKEGQDDLARARAPRRLPGGDERAWWAEVVRLLDEPRSDAGFDCEGAPGELGRWAREMLLTSVPSTPLGRYARALEMGDRCLAARLFRSEFATDGDASHVAALMVICEGHRPDAERHAAAIRDPLTQAIWRVRRGLVPKGPGWEAVARAAMGAGWRSVAAPLAWLRAAAAWRALGDGPRADAALARVGAAGAPFVGELAEASKAAGREYPAADEMLAVLEEDGLAAAVAALGLDAPPSLVAELVGAVEDLLETSPEQVRAELGKLAAPIDLVTGALLADRALPSLGVSPLHAVVSLMRGAEAAMIAGAVLRHIESDRDVLELARAVGLSDPFVLTICATRLNVAGLQAVYGAIERRAEPVGGPSSDELRIALAEGSPLPPASFPKGLVSGIAARPGPWSDYAFLLQTGVSRPPRYPADSRIAPAVKARGRVFLPPPELSRLFRDRMRAVADALEDVYERRDADELAALAGLDELAALAGRLAGDLAGPRYIPTPVENQKKKAQRKAQKAARKAARKRR